MNEESEKAFEKYIETKRFAVLESDFITEDACSKQINREVLDKYGIDANKFMEIVKNLAHKKMAEMKGKK